MHKSYSIKTHKRVDKFFAAHPDIARKAISIFNELAKNPFDSSTNFDIAKYQGRLPNNYRLRIGGFRILYEINEEEIYIYLYDAGSRGKIYK